MKQAKQLMTLMAMLLAAADALGGATNAPTFVKGTMAIRYNSRATDRPARGVKDAYTLDVNVCNSALFHGTILSTPQIMESGTFGFGKSVTQPSSVEYNLAMDVVNPRNPSQTKSVGRLYGSAPISPEGVYNYDKGSVAVDVLPIGSAPGFTSKFSGTVAGKPLGRPENWMDSVQQSVVSITRTSNGKTTTVQLKKYDRMVYNNAVLAAGPVQMYQQVTASGEMLYDYDKSCWFFNGVGLQHGGAFDRVTGTIRWVESPDRKANGEGEYQFDVRVNEPPAGEASAFSGPADESAFFQADASVPSLTGTMKYKDQLRGEKTMSSQVAIDLAGNSLTKQQVMALCKLVILSAVVPMNSD